MNGFLAVIFARSRAVMLIFSALLCGGAYAYVNIPKESNPDIPIPFVYVSTSLSGISPEDSERLLVRPLETELSSLSGLDEMEAHASEGFASVQLKFEAGFDADEALIEAIANREEPKAVATVKDRFGGDELPEGHDDLLANAKETA